MSNDELVLDLLLQFEEATARGLDVTPESLCRHCPQLLGDVLMGLQALHALDLLLTPAADEDDEEATRSQVQPGDLPTSALSAPPLPPSDRTLAPGAFVTPLVRYRKLAYHRKGGLGEVYRAYDEELHREVALKRIRKEFQYHPKSRRRFLMEAEITARLEHPCIVPVHGLTRDADGQLCYAMRFIERGTLDDEIQRFHKSDAPDRDPGERSLALRELLGRFVAVCNTIAYAHSRGILHRDLKPGNVLLGDYGETLVVDWGLAKPFDRSQAERDSGEDTLVPTTHLETTQETRLGDAEGTPAYMSPEQAAGRWDVVGPASDIFSLGAILYAILTGVQPYRDRNAAMEMARRGAYPPVRECKKQVPRALEAICHKAMAREPADRYATARELAQDLGRWLADEPVLAFPEPASARLRRWARRHKVLVTGTSALLLTALLVSGGGAWWHQQQMERQERQAAQRRQDNERDLTAALDQAQDHVSRARGLTDQPNQCEEEARQAREALQRADTVLKTASLTPEFFDRAKRIMARTEEDLRELAIDLCDRGSKLLERGNFVSGTRFLEAACQIDPKLPAAHSQLAIARQKRQDLEGAIYHARLAVQLNPVDAPLQLQLARLLRERGRFREARDVLRTLSGSHPEVHARADEQLAEVAKLIDLDHRLLGHLLRGDSPKDAATALHLATFCREHRRLYVLAVRYYRVAFDFDKGLTDGPSKPHRYNAARAAALAAFRKGEFAVDPDAKQMVELRTQALAWLEAEVGAYRQRLGGRTDNLPAEAMNRLMDLVGSSDFEGLRKQEDLAKLPPEEAKRWEQHWKNVYALLGLNSGEKGPG